MRNLKHQINHLMSIESKIKKLKREYQDLIPVIYRTYCSNNKCDNLTEEEMIILTKIYNNYSQMTKIN